MDTRASLICFTGIDGSGKTTQAKMLVEWLESRGIRSTYVWSRGQVLSIRGLFLFLGRKVLGTSARQINSDQKAYQTYQAKKGKFKRNPLIRTLWSLMTRIEHLAQINRDIRPKMREGYVVICDRYLWDSIVDLAFLNKKDASWLLNPLNRFMWKFVPQPAVTFFIDIPPEEALRRKDDIPSFEDVQVRANLYRYLADRQSMVLVDGCDNVAAIQNKVRKTMEGLINNGG